MTTATGAARRDKPTCGAKTRSGGHCGRPAGWGTDHVGIGACKLHGGATPNHAKAAQRQNAARAVAAFALPTDVEPSVALLDSLHRWYGMSTYLAHLIADMGTEDDLKQLSVGPGKERFERPSVWVELYREALKEQAKVAKACLDAGIDERRMRLTEAHGRTLDGVIRKVVEGIFAGLAGAGMRVDAIEAFQREHLPAIVRGAVMSVAFAESPRIPSERSLMAEGREVTIDLGDPASPYPPLFADEEVEPLRAWFGKHVTFACYGGDHRRCQGVCALDSEAVDERPCLCPCHFNRSVST